MLAGIRIILKIGDADHGALVLDVASGVIVYFLLTIYLGIVMYGVIPLYRHGQYGYDWRDALVCTWRKRGMTPYMTMPR